MTDDEMLARMEGGWRLGLPYTPCGRGSLPEATENVRAWLPCIASKYKLRSINDAGAGDLSWTTLIPWRKKIVYRPFDLVPRHAAVTRLDVTSQAMPRADAVLCRLVLNHLDYERIERAVDLFRACAPYLIATQFDEGEALFASDPQYTKHDLRWWLGEPLESIEDGSDEGCTLAIWKW